MSIVAIMGAVAGILTAAGALVVALRRRKPKD